MAAMTSPVMATAMPMMGEGKDDDGKDDNDGKDDEGGGSGIPDRHTTINYMTAAEEMAAAMATVMATLMATATRTMMARTTTRYGASQCGPLNKALNPTLGLKNSFIALIFRYIPLHAFGANHFYLLTASALLTIWSKRICPESCFLFLQK